LELNLLKNILFENIFFSLRKYISHSFFIFSKKNIHEAGNIENIALLFLFFFQKKLEENKKSNHTFWFFEVAYFL